MHSAASPRVDMSRLASVSTVSPTIDASRLASHSTALPRIDVWPRRSASAALPRPPLCHKDSYSGTIFGVVLQTQTNNVANEERGAPVCGGSSELTRRYADARGENTRARWCLAQRRYVTEGEAAANTTHSLTNLRELMSDSQYRGGRRFTEFVDL